MLINVKIDHIHPNPYQPESRLNIDDATAEKFGKSILEYGLLQTPVARAFFGDGRNHYYEMGDGWLRRAGFSWLVQNGHPEFNDIPLDVRELTDQQMADLVLEANGVRKDMSPIDCAKFFKKYLEDFKVTQAELARRHNISQGELANTIRLLDLPAEIQQKVISQEISETHARQLLRLNYNPELQKKTLASSIKLGYSVNQLSNEVAGEIYRASKTLELKEYDSPVFDTTQCGSCQSRQKIGSPYSGDKKSWRCLNVDCWEQKQTEAEKEAADKVAAELALAKGKDKGAEGIMDLEGLSWRDYQVLGDNEHITNPQDCKICKHRAQGKRWKNSSKPELVCINVACFKKKEKEFEAAESARKLEEERALTERLKTVVEKLDTPTCLQMLAKYAVKHTRHNTLEKFARMYDIKLEGHAGPDQELVTKELGLRFTDVLAQELVALTLQKERFEDYNNRFEYELSILEGHPDEFRTKTAAYRAKNCAGCTKDSDELTCDSLFSVYKDGRKCWQFSEPKGKSKAQELNEEIEGDEDDE